MKIAFSTHTHHPSRDAFWYFADNLFDDAGTRYPLRISIDNEALVGFEQDVPDPHDEIVKELYREELAALLAAKRLNPADGGAVNNVLFVDGTQSSQGQPTNQIFVVDAYERLKAVARRLGRLAP